MDQINFFVISGMCFFFFFKNKCCRNFELWISCIYVIGRQYHKAKKSAGVLVKYRWHDGRKQRRELTQESEPELPSQVHQKFPSGKFGAKLTVWNGSNSVQLLRAYDRQARGKGRLVWNVGDSHLLCREKFKCAIFYSRHMMSQWKLEHRGYSEKPGTRCNCVTRGRGISLACAAIGPTHNTPSASNQ